MADHLFAEHFEQKAEGFVHTDRAFKSQLKSIDPDDVELTNTIEFEEVAADSLDRRTFDSVGIYFGSVQSSASIGFDLTDISVGIFNRHNIHNAFTGEARVSLGFVSGPEYRTRLVPVEYRINTSLLRSIDRRHSAFPYFYLGGGILFHKPVEAIVPRDPRTDDLGGRLPPSTLFEFESGITPFISGGLGYDVSIESNAHLNIQIGYNRAVDRFNISGLTFRDHYFGLTLGVSFGSQQVSDELPDRRDPPPPVLRDQIPALQDGEGSEEKSPDAKLTDEDKAEKFANDLVEFPTLPSYVSVEDRRSEKCLYAIQFGSYSNINKALRAVKQAQDLTEAEVDIFYNRKNRLYAVRSVYKQSLSKTTGFAKSIRMKNGLEELPVVNQCYSNRLEQMPVPLEYQIQLASFSYRDHAIHYSEEVENRFNIETYIVETDDPIFYRVRTGRFKASGEVFRLLEMLRSEGLGMDIYLARSPESTRHSIEYDLKLYKGNFETWDDAVAYANRLWDKSGYKSKIIIDEIGRYNLVIDYEFSSWNRILEARNEFSSEVEGHQPVIQLLERAALN